jgi:hypothetical protein
MITPFVRFAGHLSNMNATIFTSLLQGIQVFFPSSGKHDAAIPKFQKDVCWKRGTAPALHALPRMSIHARPELLGS